MNRFKECVVSVAFREPYLKHNTNQERALKMLCPEVDLIYFRDELPTKDGIIKGDINKIVPHFQSSLYGFKTHAIKYAYDLGYRKIVWLDPAVLPLTPVNKIFDYPVIVKPGAHELSAMTNEKALKWFGLTKDQINGTKHIGGTVYGFNFNTSNGRDSFNLWMEAEQNGIFGTQDDFMAGHWADESCLALALFTLGINQLWIPDFKYLNQKEM